jgi:hypothetical protein
LETLVTYETLARMSLSAVKQPGIAVAYEELLGFDGDEFYTAVVKIILHNICIYHSFIHTFHSRLSLFVFAHQWPHLAGRTFGECVEHFPMAVAIGVVNNDGSVVLNPSNDYPLSVDTGIIVVAEDDDSYEAVKTPFDVRGIDSYLNVFTCCLSFLCQLNDYINVTHMQISVGSLPKNHSDLDAPDRLLFIGWTDNVKGMLEILNTIFDPGTEVHLLNRTPVEDRIRRLTEQGLDVEKHL